MKGRAARPKVTWVRSGDYEDILYDTWDGVAKITINRPEVRTAFQAVVGGLQGLQALE